MKEQARQKIGALVDRFRTNIDVYKKSAYKEAQVRCEFIDPFFEALGWDVGNKQGFAEQYKEVVLEDTIKVGLSTRAPDYSFRIGGLRKFFVEAKKPAINIKEDVSPSYQLRRYAWSAKLPLSIVTDFEEFSVFNCQMKPNQNDKVGIGRIAYFTFDEYIDKFDDIYDIFSKEAVLKGSFDRYAQSTKGKKGTAAVDSEFLKEIESWREMLAKNIALRNTDVSIYELNYAVQKIIDRIIFLRICEDRGIEPYGQLQTQAEAGDVYMHLLNHFRLAESKYNSGIFDFESDGITPALRIDDKVLKTIIQSLYYPKSPYEFSVLGVEILGNVYEQFLGKVIRLTAGHQAKVETKPEVKKAGGVYYTPQYIVEYIVENTVGKLIAGKTPEEIAHIKILDPACGSGSFLIGAYTYLLRYHRDWYTNNKPKKHKGKMFQAKANEWYLTTAEKKRILLDNIFGVDIDSQAVEVTKMSLLLKVLEHESRESIDQQMKLGLEGVLPNLGDNIKCGNSLIGPDFYDAQQGTLFNEEEMRRVNVFDWDDERKGFGGIMQRGGFDCVVGNPPYVRIQTMKEWTPTEVVYYKTTYQSAGSGNYDIYVVFVEKGIGLLNENGILGFILPHKFFQAKYGKGLRKFITERAAVREILNFRDNQIFGTASTYTCLLFLGKENLDYFKYTEVSDFSSPYKQLQTIRVENEYQDDSIEIGKIPQGQVTNQPWNFFFEDEVSVIEKMRRVGIPLEQVTERIFQGLKTGADKIYVLNVIERGGELVKIFSEEQGKEYALESELLKPLIKGGQIRRYLIEETKRVILFPYLEAKLISKEIFENDFPKSWAYLLDNRKFLENREHGKFKGSKWYQYSRNQALGIISASKIITPDFASSASYSYDPEGLYYFSGGAAGGYGIIPKKCFAPPYLLGVLNSLLVDWYLKRISTNFRGGYYSYESRFIKQLPIRTINFDDPTEKAQHDKLVALVENMLELQKKHHEARMEQDKELYERQIKMVDAQIDKQVYDLYGLTEEEIKVVVEKMRESKNLDAFAVPKKYPNIAKIFDKEWFESEFKKEKEEMHLLARDLLLIDYEEYESSRLRIEHLEDYLATMQDEIARDENKNHFYEGLRNKDFHKYRSTLAEIEIASLFKNMGFQVQLEPPIPDSGKNGYGDIKIIDAETEVFIEVRTIKGKKGEILDKWKRAEIRRMKFHKPIDFKSKIEAEIHGLSRLYPGIVVPYLDPSIINGRDIEKAFYDATAWIVNGEVVHIEPGESAMDNTIISALLVYSPCFSDGCKIRKELYLNPKANISLPDSIITKIRDSGIEIKEEPIELERNYR